MRLTKEFEEQIQEGIRPLEETELKEILEETVLWKEYGAFSWEKKIQNISEEIREQIRGKIDQFWNLLPPYDEHRMALCKKEVEEIKAEKINESGEKRKDLQRQQNNANSYRGKIRNQMKFWDDPEILNSKQLNEQAACVRTGVSILDYTEYKKAVAALIPQFRTLVSLAIDPKYTQHVAQKLPEDKEWAFSQIRKGNGFGDLVHNSQFATNAPEAIEPVLKFIRPRLDVSDKEFKTLLEKQSFEAESYTKTEIWECFRKFLIKQSREKTFWTWNDIREVKTRKQPELKNEEGEVIHRKRSGGESIGQSVSKYIIHPMKDRSEAAIIQMFQKENMFQEGFSPRTINKTLKYFDEGGHKKSSETKEQQNEGKAAETLSSFLNTLLKTPKKPWRVYKIRKLHYGENHLYPLFEKAQSYSEILRNVKQFLEKYDCWNSKYTQLFLPQNMMMSESLEKKGDPGKEEGLELYDEVRILDAIAKIKESYQQLKGKRIQKNPFKALKGQRIDIGKYLTNPLIKTQYQELFSEYKKVMGNTDILKAKTNEKRDTLFTIQECMKQLGVHQLKNMVLSCSTVLGSGGGETMKVFIEKVRKNGGAMNAEAFVDEFMKLLTSAEMKRIKSVLSFLEKKYEIA